MEKAEYLEEYKKLSVAQYSYIFDQKYIDRNPRTKETLVRKGFVLSKNYYIKDGMAHYTTKFTEKTHEMAKYRFELIRKKQKEDFPSHIVIENDQQLLEIFQEIILLGQEECDIYCHRGINGFIVSNEIDYILHPYYKWQIELDKTCGKFLKYESVTSHKGSYCYVYDKKGVNYV